MVDFYVRAHLNSPHFKNVRDEVLKEITKGINEAVYAIDDQSAVTFIDGKIDVISEGKWIKYN